MFIYINDKTAEDFSPAIFIAFGSLTLNWILTDGITTLVKITADDELMKYCSLTNLDNNLPVLSERDKQFIEENQTGIVSECNCFASRHICYR